MGGEFLLHDRYWPVRPLGTVKTRLVVTNVLPGQRGRLSRLDPAYSCGPIRPTCFRRSETYSCGDLDRPKKTVE